MDRPDDAELHIDRHGTIPEPEEESHATTAGAVAAGAVTGGVIGLAGGPVGAVVGALGGAIVAAAAERMMHSEDDEDEQEQTLTRAETPQPGKEDELASP